MTERSDPKRTLLKRWDDVNSVLTTPILDSFRRDNKWQFEQIELPHRKVEHWRFTDISPILRADFSSLTDPKSVYPIEQSLTKLIANYRYGENILSELVFLNGFWVKELSRVSDTKDVHVQGLASALEKHDPVAEKYVTQKFETNGNPFVHLNAAFLLDGAYVHASTQTSDPVVIHCLMVSTDSHFPFSIHPHNLIVVEPEAKITVLLTFVHLGDSVPHFTNTFTRFYVKENARVSFVKTLQDNDLGYHLDHVQTTLAESAVFDAYTYTLSGKLVRNETYTILEGSRASCSLNGLFLAANEQLMDNFCSIRHAAPNCVSWIGYKGVLQDKARGVFLGKIHVDRDAQKTDSKQLNNNLLLSDKAYMHTRPQLEIYADDVKCTHGATVGQPPDELIFYFRSRGIAPEKARRILTYGFAEDIVAKVPFSPTRERLNQHLLDRFQCGRHEA